MRSKLKVTSTFNEGWNSIKTTESKWPQFNTQEYKPGDSEVGENIHEHPMGTVNEEVISK